MIPFHLACKVFPEISSGNLIEGPWYKTNCFCLVAFKIVFVLDKMSKHFDYNVPGVVLP
jgi:hypothetical protein